MAAEDAHHLQAQHVGREDEIRAGLRHLQAVDPVLAGLIALRPGYDPDAWRESLPQMDLFGCLVFQIIGQQISVKAAGAVLHRLTMPFEGRIPSPTQMLTLDEPTLRAAGLSWRKAATVRDLATRFANGQLDETRLTAMSDEQIIQELTRISGIGPWTVHGALLIALRRGNVVPIGDIMLRNAVQRYYTLPDLPTEAEFSAIAAPWAPFASLGVNLLFAAWEFDAAAGAPTTRPRRGPPHEPETT